MTIKNSREPSKLIDNEIQPVVAEKSQIVYMMPHQEFEEDEIDLFQLLLPPLKYKVQILIFLIVGVIIGIGVTWYKTTIHYTSALDEKYLATRSEIKFLEEKKQFALEDFFSSIQRINGENQILKIVGAQYRFTNKNEPDKTRIFELDSYQDMANIGEEDSNENADEDSNKDSKKTPKTTSANLDKDFEILLRTEKVKAESLKQELNQSYKTYFNLKDKQTDLGYQKKANLATTYVLIEEKRKSQLSNEKETFNRQILDLRKNYLKIENQIQESLTEVTDLKHEIEYIHKTLADNVFFNTTQNEIPWKIWNDIKSQTKNGEKKQQKEIKEIAFEIEEINTEITKFNLIGYIYQNNLKLPLDAFEWPALEAIGERDKAKPKTYTTNGTGKSKILIISFIIALFIGIASVYIRAFLKKAGEKGEFNPQKQELTKALKSWKL